MIRPVEVRPLEGYRLWLRFEDGSEGGLDLCSDALYLRLTGKSAGDVFPKLHLSGVDA